MTEAQTKNHDNDQSSYFDHEKNQDHFSSHREIEGGRDSIRTKNKQDNLTPKPLRRKRRQLTGW